jgi:short-subunit dehydrogenase
VHGIHVFLPGMLARQAGHIVNVASANGLFAFPFGGAYASTKFAVVGLSEALRAELIPFGIGVTVVCPGLTRTAILNDARTKPDHKGSHQLIDRLRTILERRGADPDVVARAISLAVQNNIALVKVPLHTRVIDVVHRFVPSLYRRAIARIMRHAAPAERRPLG